MPYTVGDAMHNRGVITCQSFGLDEKITDVSRCFFLVGVTGFDATLLVALSMRFESFSFSNQGVSLVWNQ